MAYEAGDLREHVDIEKVADGKSANGYPVKSWEPLYSDVAAGVYDVSGKDYYAALAANALDTVTFVCRWLEGVDTRCRVVWNDGHYEVQQVNRLGVRRDYIQIKTKALS